MEDYSRQRHEAAGYEFVNSPHITKSNLFETSGHLDWFADGMFPPMELDGGTDYYLKPMNCPFHILIYRSRMRSYRELPLRLFEFGTVYRYEKSGVVHGLTRVRGHDPGRRAHLLHQGADGAASSRSLLEFVLDVLRDYGLDDFYLELSTKPEGKAVGTDEEWDEATEALRAVAEADGPRARDGRGRRRVLRPEDLGAGARRDRPHLADVDDPARLPAAAALRARVRRRRQRAPPAGHDPPRAVRLDRAVLRHPRRALRRRVPRVAGAGAGHGAAGRRPPRRLRAPRSSTRLQADGFRVEVRRRAQPTRSARGSGEAKLEKVPYVLVVGDDDVEHGTVGVNARGSDAPERGVAARRVRRRASPPRSTAHVARVTLERLWAGWRATYIDERRDRSRRPTPTTSACSAGSAARPRRRSLVLARNEHAFAVMNAYPYTSGHLMVAPLRHEATLAGLSTRRGRARSWRSTQDANVAVLRRLPPDGINVGANIGRAAGAGVPGHVHVHVLPRWSGDTNFMTTVAEARVLPEPLTQELREAARPPGPAVSDARATVRRRPTTTHPTRRRATTSTATSCPRTSTSPRYVGPYLFPTMRRRRIPATMYLVLAAAAASAGYALSTTAACSPPRSCSRSSPRTTSSARGRSTVDQTEALLIASRTVGFAVGHSSAQLAWRGLRARPAWRILLYSADEPPTMRGLVEIDARRRHGDGRVHRAQPRGLVEVRPRGRVGVAESRGAATVPRPRTR